MAKDNQTPLSFSATYLQIGNNQKTVSEYTDGALFFRDKFYPEGVKLSELDVDVYSGLLSVLSSVSGQIQINIDDTQYRIDVYLPEIINSIPGITAYLLNQINNNFDQLISISGHLQSDIWNVNSSLISVSGNLSSQINDNYQEFISSFDNLESQILDISASFFSSLQQISGNLQSQIVYNRNEFVNISGSLQDQITYNRDEFIGVSGSLYDQISNIHIIDDVIKYLDDKKMDKVVGGHEGNLVILDISGNAVDSGVGINDLLLTEIVESVVDGEEGWKTIDTISCGSTIDVAEWQLYAYNIDYPNMKYASRIMTIYSCLDQSVEWTEYAVLNIGGQINVPVQVIYEDSSIKLQIQGTSTLKIKGNRIVSYYETVIEDMFSLDFTNYKNSQYLALF